MAYFKSNNSEQQSRETTWVIQLRLSKGLLQNPYSICEYVTHKVLSTQFFFISVSSSLLIINGTVRVILGQWYLLQFVSYSV